MTEDYELSAYDRHELNYGQVALGRLPYKVTEDPMVTPLREFAYLPKGAMDPHGLPQDAQRAGKRPEEILEELRAAKAAKEQNQSENASADTQ